MKRLIISLAIIAVIIAVGAVALYTVGHENDRLYGHIEAVISAYESGEGVEEKIAELKSFFEKSYVRALGAFVDDSFLAELSESINRLGPMYGSDCDEFLAECESARTEAQRIFLAESPRLYRIL